MFLKKKNEKKQHTSTAAANQTRAGPVSAPARARAVKPTGGPGLPARERHGVTPARRTGDVTELRRELRRAISHATARLASIPHTRRLSTTRRTTNRRRRYQGVTGTAPATSYAAAEQNHDGGGGFRKREREGRARRGAGAHPRREHELSWGRGGARRPESAKMTVGNREEERRRYGDAGLRGSIPCARAASAARRRRWSKRGSTASFTARESTAAR